MYVCMYTEYTEYTRVWSPVGGRVPFPSIVTIWDGRTLWVINWMWRAAFHCVPLHFNDCT